MEIREAKLNELNEIATLLKQVADIHSKGRPDIFKEKTIEQLIEYCKNFINDQERSMMVAEENGNIKGVVIYKIKDIKDNPTKLDTKILSVEELVVDENFRSNGIGKKLLNKMREISRQEKCNSIELNCWSFNKRAMKFYKEYGMDEQRVFLEMKVDSML